MTSAEREADLETVSWPIGFVLDDRYVIEEHLSSGGFAHVYRARDAKLGRSVAVKLLQEQFVEHPSVRPRFDREVQTLAALSHPNIVTILDHGLFDNRPYLVVEMLEGETLRARIDRGPLSEDEAFHVMRQLLAALSYSHEKGIVHRDLKPGNIFLVSLPAAPVCVKVLDFGLVKLVAGEANDGPPLTRAGIVSGTPAYMPPEQALGDVTDGTSDVYSAGVLLYEMLTGAQPFQGELREVFEQHIRAPVPPFERHGDRSASPGLTALLQRAMAKRKQDRFPTAAEFSRAMDELPRPVLTTRSASGDVRDDPHASREEEILDPTLVRQAATPDRQDHLRVLMTRGRAAVAWARVALFDAREHGGWTGVIAAARRVTETILGARARPLPLLSAVLVVTVVVVWASRRSASEPRVDGAVRETRSVERNATATSDPWRRSPLPREFEDIRRTLQAGHVPPESVDAGLRRHASEQPGDPRPLLLLAEIFYRRHWHKDALASYRRAYTIDPGARGDPAMLRNLVALAQVEPLARAAGALVVTAYGKDALTTLDAAIARLDPTSAEAARLQRLRVAIVERRPSP